MPPIGPEPSRVSGRSGDGPAPRTFQRDAAGNRVDGQGVALNDMLVDSEIRAGTLHRLSDAELSDFGYYLAYPSDAMSNPDVGAFADWLRQAF